MASFQIHADAENNPNHVRVKAKNFANQARSVLGVVNGNKEAVNNAKNLVQKDILASKAQLISKGLCERTENIQKFTGALNKPKHSAKVFSVFQDGDSIPKKPIQGFKNETKARILKDKSVDIISKSGGSQMYVPASRLDTRLPVPKLRLPEPMSPDDSDSSMSMDISLKAEKEVSSDREVAVKELDNIKLTERLYICDEYRDEISIYLRGLQVERRPRKNYMAKQPDITHNMRAVLVDWLVEVVEEYNMTTETLYLAVSYIDRFLSSMSVVRSKLQLVGTAAMFIASKYEEIYPPDVKDFVYITDDTYTKNQVLRMEHLILRVLRFDLSSPTVLNFLMDYTSHCETADNVKYLAMYLCELSLLEGDPYIEYLPSHIAAGALCVARATLQPDQDVLPASLQRVMDIHFVDIAHVVVALERSFRAAASNVQQATHEKYKTEKYLKVSTTQPPSEVCSSLLSSESSS